MTQRRTGPPIRHPGVGRLAVAFGLVCVLVGAGCTSSDATDFPPELNANEAACELVYGSSTGVTIGPLQPGETETIDINSYTKVTVGLSTSALLVNVDREIAATQTSFKLDEIPREGVTLEGEWIDAGHPGYRITCFHGQVLGRRSHG